MYFDFTSTFNTDTSYHMACENATYITQSPIVIDHIRLFTTFKENISSYRLTPTPILLHRPYHHVGGR